MWTLPLRYVISLVQEPPTYLITALMVNDVLWKIRELLIPQAPTNFFQTLHPSISTWTTHGLPLITSPSKMTTVLIRRNAPSDSCRNLTALMPRCTKTSFIITPHYICAHRNSDNLHYAAFKGYSLVERGMADEHLIVVLHQQVTCSSDRLVRIGRSTDLLVINPHLPLVV